MNLQQLQQQIQNDALANFYVVIGDEPPSPEISVTFNNKYNYREDKGHGITNRFEYSEGGWDWYKDGVLQEGTK